MRGGTGTSRSSGQRYPLGSSFGAVKPCPFQPLVLTPLPPFVQNLEFSIGKMKVLENQNGLDGAAFDLPYNDAMVRMGD